MKLIIFVFLIISSLISKANSICGSNESVSLMSKNNKIILKCDCNCTNEENKFYINSINPIEASRLVSLDGISKITFDNLMNNKKLCKWESYKSSYEHSLIFAVKVPDENNTCFEIKEYSLGKDKEFNYPIYYSIKRTGHFNQISFDEVDGSLNYFGINELSNKLLKENNKNKLLLNKGDFVKFKYNLGKKSIVKKDNLFLEVGNDYLEPYFYINSKSYLYSKPDDKYRSNMYLIKGDQIKIIGESMNSNIQWYFINYKGKKEINMWIKADSVDLN